MKSNGLCAFVFLATSTMAAAQPTDLVQPPRFGFYEQKIQALQDEIDKLRKQQDAELTEKEREAQRLIQEGMLEEAAKKKRYTKIELRGKLLAFRTATPVWKVDGSELPLTLDLSGKKELLEFAEKYAGKEVIVTGRVVGKAPAPFPNDMVPSMPKPQLGTPVIITLVVDSLMLAEK